MPVRWVNYKQKERKPLRAEENREINMEEYRFKYYWDNGDVIFDTVIDNEENVLAIARQAAKYEKVTMVDVYQGTKLIATFYK